MNTTMSTQTMRVIRVHRYGGPDQLTLEEQARPEPRRGEVLVRLHAAGVNPIDWKIRQGLLKDVRPVTFPYTPGIEMAGVVEELGPGVTNWEIGQAVFAQVAQGGYADYLAVPAEALALKPVALSFVEAAAVPVGATTAWRTLFEKGAQVIGTASTANLEFVRALGADLVVDYTTTPVQSVVHDVDLVLDGVGAQTLSSSLAVLKPGGTLISIAGPPPQDQAQARGVRALMSRRAASVPLQTFAQMIDEGQLTVTAGKTFPLSQARQAHEYGQSKHGRGRIVLQIVDEAARGTQG
jgi:NADPH:quinone reductase-like Zn-dependent oxidoreductase